MVGTVQDSHRFNASGVSSRNSRRELKHIIILVKASILFVYGNTENKVFIKNYCYIFVVLISNHIRVCYIMHFISFNIYILVYQITICYTCIYYLNLQTKYYQCKCINSHHSFMPQWLVL